MASSDWQLSRAQAAALLKHRCQLMSFDEDIDDGALGRGATTACLPILRFLFTRFSEALDHFFCESGHVFHDDMTDEELVGMLLRAWCLLSPRKPLGAATVSKVLLDGEWGTDRLLFTLQCVLVCCQMHRSLVAKSDEEWIRRDMSWTESSPQQQFDVHPDNGTESERERSTLAWMVQAYREQMDSLTTSEESLTTTAEMSGTLQQEAWVAKFLEQQSCHSDAIDALPHEISLGADLGLSSQRTSSSLASLLSPAGPHHHDLMGCLSLSRVDNGSFEDSFDESAFDHPFIEGVDVTR